LSWHIKNLFRFPIYLWAFILNYFPPNSAKRYERLLKTHGISPNPNGSGSVSGMSSTGNKRGPSSNVGPAQKKRKYVEPPPGTESADEDLGEVVKEENLEPEKGVVKTEPDVDPAVVATVSGDAGMSVTTVSDSRDGNAVSAAETAPDSSASRPFSGIIQPVPGDIWDTIEEAGYTDPSLPVYPFTFRAPLPGGCNAFSPLPEDLGPEYTFCAPSIPLNRRATGTQSSVVANRSATEDPYAGSIYLRNAPWKRTTLSGHNPTELSKETSLIWGEDVMPGPTPKSRLEGGSGVNARELRYSCARDACSEVLERKVERAIEDQRNGKGLLGNKKEMVVVEIPSDDEDEGARERGSKQKPISI
jgi:hypothetical protein